MVITKKKILEEIIKLHIYYALMKRPHEEIEMLADMWHEDLGHISEDKFLSAVKQCRRKSSFFPTPKDLLDIIGPTPPKALTKEDLDRITGKAGVDAESKSSLSCD